MTTLWNGIPLGVQNWCFRKFGNGEIPGLLKECGLAALEICQAHDTGWLLDAGGDSVEFARRGAGRIYGVHFKDFHYWEDGTREEALLGEGLLESASQHQALCGTIKGGLI